MDDINEVSYSILHYPNQFHMKIDANKSEWLDDAYFKNSIQLKEEIDDNFIECHETTWCPRFISNIKIENYSLTNYSQQTNDICDDLEFIPKEWMITDPTSKKCRAPRQYEFLQLILNNPRYKSYISWLEEEDGTFRIYEPAKLAALWAKVKNRQTTKTMDYNKFARGLRCYYKSGSMLKTHRKHTFRFNLSDGTP